VARQIISNGIQHSLTHSFKLSISSSLVGWASQSIRQGPIRIELVVCAPEDTLIALLIAHYLSQSLCFVWVLSHIFAKDIFFDRFP
jgi:hypothetical protein